MEMQTVLILISVMFVLFLGALGGFWIYFMKVYKYRVRLFYKLSGEDQYHEGKTHKARKVLISKSGVPRLWVPGLKEFVSYFGKKMGPNKYYYAEGPDGYLYNIVLGDLDNAKGVLDIDPIDKDVRDFYISNQKNINERYDKPKNWPVILQSITIVLAVLIMMVGGYIIFDKTNEASALTNENLEKTIEVTQLQEKLLGRIGELIEEMRGGGSGLQPAPITP